MTSGDVGAKTRRRRGAQSQAGMEDGEDRPCKGPEAGPGPEQSSETSVARAEWGGGGGSVGPEPMVLGPAVMARTLLSLSETGGFWAHEGQKSSQALP